MLLFGKKIALEKKNPSDHEALDIILKSAGDFVQTRKMALLI